ncbi:conjugative transposon protein TraN [Flavobacterium turcicum]|uniref:Conjugative transposon protein TraN n=1 Tax=Flavobacterium turcicum TaxID=2764718 RepID=A0ABR7JED9_9FLAO|nr:conjugative transposon protein TraN [Flavobacterium turcicum]MBC5862876.1 conjugative transposon protein TraN [Flavobacterium turcicum]NHL01608.1 conjugative transposon protein TraN [Flavobacterium turcicum]
MKNFNVLVMVYFLLITMSAMAQQTLKKHFFKIEPDSLTIGFSKTSNIIFPFAIKSFDKGSQDVLVQKAKGVENILQIKAAQQGFLETNLTVVTADGVLYSFVLNYDENAPILNLSVNKNKSEGQELFFSPDSVNEKEVQEYSKLSFYDKKKLRGAKESKYKIAFELNGIFVKDNVMYYRITVTNNSKINYDIDQLRLFIHDTKKIKRTASQEIEIIPIYILNDVPQIKFESENAFVYALPKFTIPEQKHLVLQLIEKNGGRNLELHIKNKKLMKVKVLTTL